MADESTTKFKVDISELKKGMQEAARQVRLANSEFKAATSGMDNWGKSADGISAKIKQLDSVLESQNSQLENLQKQYELVVKEEGATSKGAQELLIKINNQKAAIGKTNAELNKWKKALSEVDSEQDEVVSATDELKNSISDQESELASLKKKYTELVLTQGKSSREAKDTAKAISELSKDLKKNKSALSGAEDAADDLDHTLDDVAESAESAGDGFTVFKGVVSDLISSGIKNLISTFTELASSTREYRGEMAKLDNAFTNNGYSVETARDTYAGFYALLGDEGQATEAVSHLAKLTDSEEELAKWTTIATGVYGTFGDSLPIEGLTEAANETAKVGQVTGPLADALNWTTLSTEQWNEALSSNPKAAKAFQKGIKEGMSAEDAFNEALTKCTTEQERQELIMNSLTGMYGEAGEAYRQNNADLLMANNSQARLTDAYAKFGEIAEPITSSIKLGIAALLEEVVGLTEGTDFSVISDGIEEGFAYLIDPVFPAIKEGFQFILDNKDEIIAGIIGIGAGFAAWNVVTTIQGIVKAIQGIVKAIKAWTVATEGLTIAQKLLNVAQKANVIGIVITIITALVAAFITLWNTSDEFRAFWIGLWEKIKEVAGAAWEGIKEFFSEAWVKIQEIWESAKEFFAGIWEGIKETFAVVGEWFSEVFNAAKTAIEEAWDSVVTFFTETWEAIKEVFAPVAEFFSVIIESVVLIFQKGAEIIAKVFELAWAVIKAVWAIVADWFKGVWENIKEVFKPIVEWFKEKFQAALDAIKNIWNKAKKFFSDVWSAIKKVFSNVASWFKDKFQKAWDAIKNIWNKAKSFFSDIWTGIKNIFSNVAGWFGDKFSAAWQAIKDKFAGWGEFWDGLWTKIKNKFSDIGSNVGSAISDSIKSGLNGVLSTVESTINKGIRLINKAINLANKIPGVDVGNIDEITLPRLARGGVLKKGQVGLLEGNGAEAVVPLENNKRWIAKTAQDLRKSLKNEGVIGTGKDSAGVVNNYNFTQNNTSPKALSRLEIYRQTRNQLNFAKGV